MILMNWLLISFRFCILHLEVGLCFDVNENKVKTCTKKNISHNVHNSKQNRRDLKKNPAYKND